MLRARAFVSNAEDETKNDCIAKQLLQMATHICTFRPFEMINRRHSVTQCDEETREKAVPANTSKPKVIENLFHDLHLMSANCEKFFSYLYTFRQLIYRFVDVNRQTVSPNSVTRIFNCETCVDKSKKNKTKRFRDSFRCD